MNFPAEPKIANWMKESRLSKVCRNTAVHCPAQHTAEGVKNICINFHNIQRRRFYTFLQIKGWFMSYVLGVSDTLTYILSSSFVLLLEASKLIMSFINNTWPKKISFRTINCLQLQRHSWTAPQTNLPVGVGFVSQSYEDLLRILCSTKLCWHLYTAHHRIFLYEIENSWKLWNFAFCTSCCLTPA